MSRKTRSTIGLALVVATVGVSTADAETTPAWRHALAVRSDGLNREYHLGRFAVPATAATTIRPAWLTALEARSRALDQRYKLGQYNAPHRGVDVKKYTAVGVALAAMLAALIAAGVLIRRHSHRGVASVPKSA
jgi:hypothetical protein